MTRFGLHQNKWDPCLPPSLLRSFGATGRGDDGGNSGKRKKDRHARVGEHPIFLVLSLLLFLSITFPAEAARRAVAELSEDFVAVNEGFSGAQLMVFGLMKAWGDIAIVIEGPPAQAWVREKTKKFGIWINGEPTVLNDVPSYYAVVTSRPIAKMIDDSMAKKHAIGAEALPFASTPAGKGLIALRKAKGFYQDMEGGVKILDNRLFRANINLPASVPIGTYKAHIYEFSKGHLTASRTEEMRVAQVGLGAQISELSRSSPALYGVLSLLLSLGIGGVSAYLFRRKK